jgi:hypothetical protein
MHASIQNLLFLSKSNNIYHYHVANAFNDPKKNKEHRNAMQPGFQQNISQKLCHEGAFVFN